MVKPITTLQTQLATVKTDLAATRRALSNERTAHNNDVTALEQQLREHHEQAEEDLGLLRNQLAVREGQVRRESRLTRSQQASEGLGTSTSSSPARSVHMGGVPRVSTAPSFVVTRERAQSPNPQVATYSSNSSLPNRRTSTPDGSARRPSVLDTSAQIDDLVGLHGQQLHGLREQIAQERTAHEAEVTGLKARINQLQVGWSGV